MPIYAYKCGSCGHAKDVLQKMSDTPLSTCPACGADAFSKQVTAAGFQLKGSGWYVTDFRNNSSAGSSSGAAKPDGNTATTGDAPAKTSSSSSDPDSSKKPTDAAPATKSDGPAASAGGCGSACACH